MVVVLSLLLAACGCAQAAAAGSDCFASLADLCAGTDAGRACDSCAGRNQHDLRLAGCTSDDIDSWCTDSPGGGITVAADVPGRAASVHYAMEAQPASGEGAWQPVFVMESTAKNASSQGYFDHINGFTSSWASVMLSPRNSGGVRVRVTRIVGPPIFRAAVYPARSGATVAAITVKGAVEVLVPRAARFTLTVDGGLDDVDTGPNYKGPPIHTFSCFINPPLATPSGAGVLTIAAGKPIPPQLPEGTTALVFGPGEHHMQPVLPSKWAIWTLPDSVRVHVPMSAVLYFALQSQLANNITVQGYGSISGEEMLRCPGGSPDQGPDDHGLGSEGGNRDSKTCTNNSPQGLSLKDFAVKQASISGITFIDFPNHHVIAGATNKPCGTEGDTLSVIENVKVMGWRANGDGIHVFGHWLVKDVFLRTQDDSLYLQAGGPTTCPTVFEGVTTWNDANGAAFMLIGMSCA